MNAEAHKMSHHLDAAISAAAKPSLLILPSGEKWQYETPPHFHSSSKLLFQLSGSTVVTTANGDTSLEANRFALIPARSPYLICPTDEKCHLLSLLIGPHLSCHLLAAEAEELQPHSPLLTSPLTGERASLYFEELLQHHHNPTISGGILRTLLGYLHEGVADSQKSAAKVEQSRTILDAEFGDAAISVAQIARRIGCNPDYLSQSFSREMGSSISKYLTDRRLSCARALLDDRSLSIAEIAWACGYSDPSYFIRVFKQQMGSSPHALRSKS